MILLTKHSRVLELLQLELYDAIALFPKVVKCVTLSAAVMPATLIPSLPGNRGS